MDEHALLCIGGYFNGRWISLPDHEATIYLAASITHEVIKPLMVPSETYHRQRVSLGEAFVDILVVEGMTHCDVLKALLRAYRLQG